MNYIQGNLDCLEEYVTRHIPQISLVRPEGTYLAWLDCRRLGLGKLWLGRLMLDEAGAYLDDGFIFGCEGEGFERINMPACDPSCLKPWNPLEGLLMDYDGVYVSLQPQPTSISKPRNTLN